MGAGVLCAKATTGRYLARIGEAPSFARPPSNAGQRLDGQGNPFPAPVGAEAGSVRVRNYAESAGQLATSAAHRTANAAAFSKDLTGRLNRFIFIGPLDDVFAHRVDLIFAERAFETDHAVIFEDTVMHHSLKRRLVGDGR